MKIDNSWWNQVIGTRSALFPPELTTRHSEPDNCGISAIVLGLNDPTEEYGNGRRHEKEGFEAKEDVLASVQPPKSGVGQTDQRRQ